MESEVPTEIVISARERRSTPGTMYSPSPHGKTARRTAAPDRHDLFTFHRFHCSRSSWTGAFSYGCATSRRDFPITKFFSCRINGKDFKHRTVHPEPDIADGRGSGPSPTRGVYHGPGVSRGGTAGAALTSSRGSGFVPAKPPVA